MSGAAIALSFAAALVLSLNIRSCRSESLALEINHQQTPGFHGRRPDGGEDQRLIFVQNPNRNNNGVSLPSLPVLQNVRVIEQKQPLPPPPPPPPPFLRGDTVPSQQDILTPLVKTCAEGYELVKSKESGSYDCRCKKYHLYWPQDGNCYREYNQGPCPTGHRLVFDETKKRAECACPFFSAKFSDGQCYHEYTQGPCSFGQLLILDKESGLGKCVCGPQLRMYYHEPTRQCFELYKQGPCPQGHILSYNYGELKPQCKCKDGYHLHSDGKCYSLNTEGPCGKELRGCSGTPCFMKSLEAIDVKCTCLPELSTTEDGRCYQPFTRGPCQFGKWLVFKQDGKAVCEDKVYCKRFDNWHWWQPHQRCYRQFSQGPCKKGQLFYLNPQDGDTGCDCRPRWEAYYYANNGNCYEQESKGPCPVGQYFAYNATSRSTECSCFKNFVFNPIEGNCVELYTRGPCPDGQLVVAKPGNVLGCDCGPFLKNHYWLADGKCYPHYERGPCKENQQFRKHPTKDKGPACIVWGGTSQANGYK